jgi:nuclear GTP-binding protein
MESDDLAPIVPRKRSRSPSASVPDDPVGRVVLGRGSGIGGEDTQAGAERAPKRLRREKARDAGGVTADERMARANPLGRRALKKDAKRARRAAQRAQRAGTGDGAGMEVDEGLRETFMVV